MKPLVGKARQARDAAVVEAFLAGHEQPDIAEAFGISRSRVTQILSWSQGKREAIAAERQRRADAKPPVAVDRVELVFEWYAAGLSHKELAARFDTNPDRVSYLLRQHPDYVPRVGNPNRGAGIPVPRWVPARHHARYRRLAAVNGEEIAAGCIRRLKRLEAA